MKKIIALILSAAVLALSFCACGVQDKNSEPEPIRVGIKAGTAPFDEIFYSLVIRLNESGYELEYVEFENSAQADEALAKGEIDFSCITTKKEFDAAKNEALVNIGPIYYRPYAIYLLNYEKEENIENGASVAIPSDAEGMARALMLLESRGFITLKEGADVDAKLEDIEKNDRKLEIKPVDAAAFADCDADVMITDSATAAKAGYELRFDSACSEQADSLAAETYSTLILMNRETASDEKMETVKKYLFTRRMFNAVDGCTDHMVVPSFEPK